MSVEKAFLILLAHGSSDPEWQKPFEQLTRNIAGAQSHPVALAYMELCQPSLESVIGSIAPGTYENVEIVPLFFAAGRHLRTDVPAQIEQLNKVRPDLTITLHDPVGLHPVMQSALVNIIANLDFSDKK
ncbi:sirohydrochlorin chelatase [Oceanospirillum sediminis]|uniref:CbiX/SirB N-terminal domain-containing protein n=1 Tax=Oceanospirillum sediminis TaxID=2760088 RepID=A0A839IWP6_9GAMM|nr:CbiX/SirB N-terminal domain-containing protein [Oceanospirillum sediminis]MBB1488797.1 CbiX/SirB N-terminal domain-containing protein [Oceanospirillum sediminis]